MKRNETKRAIYIRIFGAFFAIYLVLMSGFSVFLVSQEKELVTWELGGVASLVNNTVGEILQDRIDSGYQITDFPGIKKEFAGKSPLFTLSGMETAVFTGDYDLIFNTNGYWLCSYTEYSEGNRNYLGEGFLNPKDWFNEKEIQELENYLYAKPKAKKVGDLSGYLLHLEGFWLDNEMIIPDKISVIAMYARAFDEKGEVISAASGEDQNARVYISDYQNIKGLPYFEHGSIRPNNNVFPNSEAQSQLRNMVTDKKKLKEAVKLLPDSEDCERLNFLTYRYYNLMPYENQIKATDNQNNYSEFWTVIARDVDLWERCSGTLIFVWSSCLITFIIATVILSRQTYKTYQKREELERQRKETTNALAHDLKTPLSIISGYAQNLMENIHTEKREHYAGGIQDNVNRMDKIIQEMLELSRLESDLFPVEFEDVSLGEVCAEIAKRYSQVCAERRITTYLEGDAVVKADHSLIARVIDNFFVNALDNTPEGGTIGIRITENTLEFYNSGSHIPEDKMDEIWLPYKKVDASRSNTKGTGLGLSIARTILELYKFSYGVKNSDEGVSFWFKFA